MYFVESLRKTSTSRLCKREKASVVRIPLLVSCVAAGDSSDMSGDQLGDGRRPAVDAQQVRVLRALRACAANESCMSDASLLPCERHSVDFNAQ